MSASVISSVASPRPGVKGTSIVEARGLGRLFDADVPGQDDDVRDRRAHLIGDGLEHAEHRIQTFRLVAGPVLLRGKADARAIGAAAHVRGG